MLIETESEKSVEVQPARISSIGIIARLAEDAADARIEFLEMALHDLQTPAAVLDLSLKLLAGDLSSADPETLATLRGAERAVRRIQQHIDHLVTSERVSSGRLRPRRARVDLVPLLMELVADYATQASVDGITLELDVGGLSNLFLSADAVLLSRIFQNLLENSLRHTGKGGHVFVRARGGGAVEVQICNDGPAIPHAERERIFSKYNGRSRGHRESGLGLYFCRLAVRAHGGTITLQDSPEWPTSFVVCLPVAAIPRRE